MLKYAKWVHATVFISALVFVYGLSLAQDDVDIISASFAEVARLYGDDTTTSTIEYMLEVSDEETITIGIHRLSGNVEFIVGIRPADGGRIDRIITDPIADASLEYNFEEGGVYSLIIQQQNSTIGEVLVSITFDDSMIFAADLIADERHVTLIFDTQQMTGRLTSDIPEHRFFFDNQTLDFEEVFVQIDRNTSDFTPIVSILPPSGRPIRGTVNTSTGTSTALVPILDDGWYTIVIGNLDAGDEAFDVTYRLTIGLP